MKEQASRELLKAIIFVTKKKKKKSRRSLLEITPNNIV